MSDARLAADPGQAGGGGRARRAARRRCDACPNRRLRSPIDSARWCCGRARTRRCATFRLRSSTSKARSRSIRRRPGCGTSSGSCAPTRGRPSAPSTHSAMRRAPIRATPARGTTSAMRCAPSARIADAIAAVERAVAADPKYALAWANLGALRARRRRRRRRRDGAAARAGARPGASAARSCRLPACCANAATCRPPPSCSRGPRELDPRDANACLLLGGTLAERDDLAGARAAYDEARRRDPRMLRALFGRCAHAADGGRQRRAVERRTRAFTEGLSLVEAEAPQRAAGLSADRLQDELRWSNFLLAYQGEDDRALQARYGECARSAWARRRARMAAAAVDPCPRRIARESRLRVDVLSRRHGRSLFRALDHRPAARDVRGVCRITYCRVPIRLRNESPRARIISGTVRGGALHSSRRAFARTRSTSSCIRSSAWARLPFRAGRPAPGADAMRRLGTSGDDRPAYHRRILLQRGNGAGRGREPLHREAGRAPRHRHALSRAPGSRRRGARRLRPAFRRAAFAMPAIAVQDPSRQRCVVRAGAAAIPDARDRRFRRTRSAS